MLAECCPQLTVVNNVNGNMQLSQLEGEGYVGGSVVSDKTARNPVSVTLLSDLNLTVMIFVLLTILHGRSILPQCLDVKLIMSSSTTSYLQAL